MALCGVLGLFGSGAVARVGWGCLFGIAARALSGWDYRLRLPAVVGLAGKVAAVYYLVLHGVLLPILRHTVQEAPLLVVLVLIFLAYVAPVLPTGELFRWSTVVTRPSAGCSPS